MSETNGRQTGDVSAELSELAAARSAAFQESERRWVAYQKAVGSAKTHARAYWQAAELDWLAAQRKWREAARAEEAREGLGSG